MCGNACSNKCNSKFSNDDRLNIYKTYWSLDYTSRRKWLAGCIKTVKIQRRRVNTSGQSCFRKKESRIYFLQKDEMQERVCLSFFLKTLGYKSDSVIMELRKAAKKAPLLGLVKENRGRKKNDKRCNYRLIENHLNSYNPCVAHYRRHNTPNARYLPMGLKLKDLYSDFKSKNPNVCSKETYRKTMIDLGISLHTPENDICDDCAYFDKVKTEFQATGEEMPEDIKRKYEEHSTKATEATEAYNKDKEAEEGRNLKIYSMDLEKVLLIPIMPKVKETFFVSRLVVFNETFASLKPGAQSYCCVWHEAIAGRDAPQIIDSILSFIREERDTENLVLWADNCSSQNKNWFLFTALVTIVNTNIASQFLKTITMKYLTKGHTHMTADGVHGNIEQALKSKGDIYDYKDLLEIIKQARRKLRVIEVEDFHKWPKKKRQPRRRNDDLQDFKLKNIVEVKFQRGSRKMMFKNRFNDEYKEIDFLLAKFNEEQIPEEEPAPRGIDKTKKNKIMSKLVRIMPKNRESFWSNLPEKENILDLVTEGQLSEDDD